MSRERKEPDFGNLFADNPNVVNFPISGETRESLARFVKEHFGPLFSHLEERQKESEEKIKQDRNNIKVGIPVPSSS
jgi:hypothetical protein